jgi:hypothetical protein
MTSSLFDAVSSRAEISAQTAIALRLVTATSKARICRRSVR